MKATRNLEMSYNLMKSHENSLFLQHFSYVLMIFNDFLNDFFNIFLMSLSLDIHSAQLGPMDQACRAPKTPVSPRPMAARRFAARSSCSVRYASHQRLRQTHGAS